MIANMTFTECQKKGGSKMAEFCLDCWNELNGTNYSKRKYVVSKDLDLCEGCGEWKHVIICQRKGRWRRRIKFFFMRRFGKI